VQLGLIISVGLHAALLGWALLTIHSQRDMRAHEPEPIITAIVTEGELTKLKQGVRAAKKLEAAARDVPKPDVAKKDVAKPKPAVVPPPPPPEPKSDPIAEKLTAAEPPPPPPPPAVDEQKQKEEVRKVEEKRLTEEKRIADEKLALERQRTAEEEKRAEDQRRAEEQKREEEERRQAEMKKKADEEKRLKEAADKKKRDEERRKKLAEAKRKKEEEERRREAEAKAKAKFDPDAIQKQLALLDKDPRKKSAPAATPPPEKETKDKGPTLGAPEGRDKQISASEIAVLKGRISQRLRACWRLPSAGGGSDTPVVTLRWRLKPDGSLDGDPQVEQPRGDALFRVAAEAALRAVRECSPFDLPPETYSTWKTITWEFDPSQMM
jgi:colicin import membrane protein